MKGAIALLDPNLNGDDDYFDFFFAGREALAAKDLCDASRCLETAVQTASERVEAHPELAAAIDRARASRDAESCYRLALELDPECHEAHLNHGRLLMDQKRFGEARGAFDRAIDRFPYSPAVWQRLGALHLWTRHEEEAERCLRQSLSLDEGYLRARFTLGQLLLRQGRFEEGWQALEARPLNVAYSTLIPAPRWQGECLAGKSLLIGQEGGYGDMIQFCRYVPVLKEQGAARIGIICQPALKGLFESLPGVDAVVGKGELVPDLDWDFWTLPLTLPLRCGTRLDSIPASIPYLRPRPDQVLEWRLRIPAEGIRVGLAWRGNPQHSNDADRSMPLLELLGPLGGVPGLHFTSLQKGAGEEEAAHPPQGIQLFDPGPWIEDFADTAALVADLDLVITIDSAIAHLAGAIGKPCWVLLPDYKTDWRWLTDREDSPWYPDTMRLFRQRSHEGWAPVIERIASALGHFVPVSGNPPLP